MKMYKSVERYSVIPNHSVVYDILDESGVLILTYYFKDLADRFVKEHNASVSFERAMFKPENFDVV